MPPAGVQEKALRGGTGKSARLGLRALYEAVQAEGGRDDVLDARSSP